MSLDALSPSHWHPVDWSIVGPALVAGLLVLSTHVPLGQRVLRKGIVFIDLAIAQIAGLGVITAGALGWPDDGWAVQGAAVGGEVPSAWTFVAEHAPIHHRGYALGFLQAGLTFGYLLGALTATLLAQVFTPAEILDYAWRFPFLLGGVFGVIGVWLRRWLSETPVFLEMQARRQVCRPMRKLLPGSERFELVAHMLRERLSPEQIAGKLRSMNIPSLRDAYVCRETIYNAIYALPVGELRKELIICLRQGKTTRRPRSGGVDRRGQIPEMVSIHVRPPEIEDRLMPGHWEGDLITGSNNSHIATLVERHSRFVMLVKVKGKDTSSVVSALSRQVKTLPTALRKSLTTVAITAVSRCNTSAVQTAVPNTARRRVLYLQQNCSAISAPTMSSPATPQIYRCGCLPKSPLPL